MVPNNLSLDFFRQVSKFRTSHRIPVCSYININVKDINRDYTTL